MYWMLECTGCGARRVVYDSYLVSGAGEGPNDTQGNYGGPPLEERYRCLKACNQGMRAIGSIHEPGDQTMRQYKPYVSTNLDQSQIEEWSRLIREAGLDDLRIAGRTTTAGFTS